MASINNSVSINMKIGLYLAPRIYILSALLYSLSFVGIYIPQISIVCVIVTLPFTPIAWMVGMAAVQLFGSESVYPIFAWIAVLIQVYCVAFCIWKSRAKKAKP